MLSPFFLSAEEKGKTQDSTGRLKDRERKWMKHGTPEG